MRKKEFYAFIEKCEFLFNIMVKKELITTGGKAPSVEVGQDNRCYFNSKDNKIHLGYELVEEMFNPETKEDAFEAFSYVLGHEIEHKRSTASRPYAIGIKKGVEEIIKYVYDALAKEGVVYSGTIRFRKEQDLKKYADDLKSKGVYISFNQIMDLVAGIQNSVEDGRIERMRAKRSKKFRTLRRKYRGMFWAKGEVDENVSDAVGKLRLITNNILTLATCQVYQRGFIEKHFGADVFDEVQAVMPFVAEGYMARNTRAMTEASVKICKYLAPYIYEAAKQAAASEEAMRQLQQMIADAITDMLENSLSEDNTSENDEIEDSGDDLPEGTFPESDLVVTLPDEVYDKLKDKMNGESGNGIKVQREHPEESDESEDKGSDGKSDSKTGEDEENTEDGTSEGTSGEDSDDGDKKAESNEDAESEDQTSSPASPSAKQPEKEKPSNNRNKTKAVLNKDPKQSEKEILDAIKEAAKKTRVDTKTMVNQVESASSDSSAKPKTSKKEASEILDCKELSNLINRNFVEVKREYAVDTPLPSDLMIRGKIMYRKNKRYFKSLSTPNISQLEKGVIDPSRIYALSFGDAQIFRKIGNDKKFDGCAYVLVDNSGSMGGNKRMEAAKAAAVIEEGFRNMFPMKIVAFDEWGTINHEVIKGWTEWKRMNCCYNFALHGRSGSGNEDGYDIQIATKELMDRPEKKKMLVILSDGAPGAQGLVKKAVQDARKKGIEVYSIYFEEGGMSQSGMRDMQYMYEKDYVCCPLSELDDNLNKLFKKFSRTK